MKHCYLKNLIPTPRDSVRRYSVRRRYNPEVLQLYKQEKFLEKWLNILILGFHLQKYDSEGRWQKRAYLRRTSVNATLSDLRSSNWSHSEEKSSTAVEFELSDKLNPQVINSFSVIHKFSKLKRWVTVEEFTSISSLISLIGNLNLPQSRHLGKRWT